LIGEIEKCNRLEADQQNRKRDENKLFFHGKDLNKTLNIDPNKKGPYR